MICLINKTHDGPALRNLNFKTEAENTEEALTALPNLEHYDLDFLTVVFDKVKSSKKLKSKDGCQINVNYRSLFTSNYHIFIRTIINISLHIRYCN